MLVGLSYRESGRLCLGGHAFAVTDVLRGDLQAVDEDTGAAGVDAIGCQGQDYVGQCELDGVGVFERG
ncbi:hypothetical protein H7849_19435 [Alloacidobacterium dinghuense]|uniref:Uncharacterized protein n=1 Tax=Alloacidobacterium dinghuense TaxID=2763107 RepID=A0A7G8BFC3_9BACT|nr:hypothetical protein [Alloacidobacterium dinghuense]QNI31243.1 hypothetical protein H7849_19435 [Alloacidobacterium dinghuense]